MVKKSKKTKLVQEPESEPEVKPKPEIKPKTESIKNKKKQKERVYDANKRIQHITDKYEEAVREEIKVGNKTFLNVRAQREVKGHTHYTQLYKAMTDNDKLNLGTTAAFLKSQDAYYKNLNETSKDKEYSYMFRVSDGHKDIVAKTFDEEFRLEDFMLRVQEYIDGQVIEQFESAFEYFYSVEILIIEKPKSTQNKRNIQNIKNKMKQQELNELK